MSLGQVTVKCEDCHKRVALADTRSVFVKDAGGETARKTVCNKCEAAYQAWLAWHRLPEGEE